MIWNNLLKFLSLIALLVLNIYALAAETKGVKMPQLSRELNAEEARVIVDKGTERPFSGKYNDFKLEGVYGCFRCGAALYRSLDKFDSGCGWPAFDDEIPGAIKQIPDSDGQRIEIQCSNCNAHLGHIFSGEKLTDKDTRHCVNSISLAFIPTADLDKHFKRAVFAGGCFWGVEYYLQAAKGVIQATSGYTGGKTANPTYQEVCSGTTGHLEAIEVLFDPQVTDYEKLLKLFFEIHDPTQIDGQGPDRGSQYLSVVFVQDKNQQLTAEKVIKKLEERGYKVATKIEQLSKFYPAEEYHQDYYFKTGTPPIVTLRPRALINSTPNLKTRVCQILFKFPNIN